MYKNYLKIAYRNIAKNKLFSTINFIGLSVGLASFAILMKFVLFESSYDSFHKKSDHIYRLVTGKFAKVPDLWSAGIKNDFPEVLSFVRMQFAGRQFVANGEKRFYESYGMFADSNFFDIFSFRLLQGNSHNVLTAEKSIVVTRSFAYKYFGNENPVDKTLTFFNDEGNGVDYKITGVCEDVPPNSHFTFDYLISNSSNKAPWVNNWTWDQFYSYLLLKDNVNKTELTSKITKWLSTKLDKEQMPGSIDLQKITDIHLHSNLEREMSVNRDISTLYIFGGIGILILLIAVINFVNLTTAKSVTRAKEVGIRKTIGAGTGTLFKQFLGESLLTTLSVFLISILILNLILPSFNELFSSNLHFSLSKDLFFIAALLAITLLAGIAGSVYPAMVLSSLKPTRILKGEIVWRGGSTLRKSLVVVQFAISSFLIISSLVIYSQMKFIQNKKLGFNKDHIIYFQITNDNIRNNTEAIKSELLSYTGVKSVTVSANLPGGGDYGIPYKAEGIDDSKRPVMRILVVDEDFFKTYGIELLAGRNFSKDIPTDRSAYILNETAAKTLGWKNPLSKKLSMPVVKRDWAPVIGVVTDFHYRSLHEKIEPLMIIEEHKDWYSYFSLKINTENIGGLISKIDKVWKSYDSVNPLQFSFMDEKINSMYLTDERDGNLVFYFSVVSILIACLGLYGLFTFSVARKTKEIGIRKILGASNSIIFAGLSKEYLQLILFGSVISWPAAYYFVNNWLQDFAYRISVGWQVFIISTLTGLLIAFISIGYQSIKASHSNPVEALRYE